MASSLVFRLHDRGPELVREVLLERGWEEYDQERRREEDWNLYWRGSAFCSSQYRNLLPWQRLNHHPKTVGITRKDCLARNLRRMRSTYGPSLYDFCPATFILPNDYTRFLAEHSNLRLTLGPSVYWICKPVDLSRGRGIFVFQDIKDLVYDCSVVVQRYVSDPLLISGYKFDLRIYACVKSFQPLTVYVHQEGLVRFATEKHDLSSLRNPYAHLTNTSINKLGPFYGARKERVGRGCKWTMGRFRHFLRSQDVDELLLWQRISNIVTLTLLAVAPSAPSCPNCVELLGFDVLVDVGFKPWLLEVNYSPALTLDCQADLAVKKGLVGDLIDVMNYTSIDGLRERAYKRREHKHPCFHAKQLAHVPIPVPSKFKETKFLKTLHQRRSRQHDYVTNYRRQLPPVDFNRMSVARGRIINTTSTDRTLNPVLGPQSRSNVPRPRVNGRLHVSGVTNLEAETKLSEETDGRSTASWKLPDIDRGSHELVTTTTAPPPPRSGRHLPPPRVGGFIRTFPFNAATLNASRHKLDVKRVVQELQQLTGRLQQASGQSDQREEEEEESRRKKKKKKKDAEGEDDFDSLLWGPKDPPLLSRCFEAT